MTTAAANTIFLDGLRGNREELVAASGTSIKPGMLIRRTSANEANVHNVSGGAGATLIAVEDEYQGDYTSTGGVDKAYAVASPVFCEYALPGAKRYLLLKASENVAIGDFLISGGDGTFIKTTGTPSKVFAQVEEASNVASAQLIRARIL